jgi:formate hydrogenlyase subunit 3/multisubunit Na+/H+ antiporter MnhD subunit
MSLDYPYFKIDALNQFVCLAVGLFFILTLIYSFRFMRGRKGLVLYYLYILLTAVAAIGAVLANNLAILLIFWGSVALMLYLLINMGNDPTGKTAQKTLVIVGGTDALMLIGIGILFYLTGTFQMDNIHLSLASNNYMPVLAYICIASGCFAKAGIMPMHSWIPSCSKDAPVPVAAYLPASLDKLLGFYLLARISLNMFVMNEAMNIFLMVTGVVTLVGAALMALVEPDMKKMLGYSTVSQVGYMALGLGTGSLIGIAGALFHMLNHAVYKAGLFFAAGNVEYRAKTSSLDSLGGLSRVMPVTYFCCLVFSLSIAGVPPLSGFFSKWMIYQGIIERLGSGYGKGVAALCLAAAMFGSGLTLATFMKFIHAVFLGQRPERDLKEAPASMCFPPFVLAAVTLIFGVFAVRLPLKYLIFPAVPGTVFAGSWYAGLSTLLIIAALILGLFISGLSGIRPRLRKDRIFVGGEPVDFTPNSVTGSEFYNTVRDYGILKWVYRLAGEGTLDIYEQAKKLAIISRPLRFLHNGVLPTYLVWMLLGLAGLLLWSCI